MKGLITGIKRFAIHDGDGIRTTVFFKGCPLRCVWCHNPESLKAEPQIAYMEEKCISCGRCADLCEANIIRDNIHIFERKNCSMCEKCVFVCPQQAFKIYGKLMDTDELLDLVSEDKKFYMTSGGGVTLSGGECLMQPEFCIELLKKLKENNINTAVDTCGYADSDIFEKTMPYTDTYLYDVKAIDEDVHIKCTGVSNTKILKNLLMLDRFGKKTEVRIPYVPGYNDNQIDKIAVFLKELKNLTGIRVLKYHNLAGSKYKSLEMENTLPKEISTPEDMVCVRQKFEAYGLNVIE